MSWCINSSRLLELKDEDRSRVTRVQVSKTTAAELRSLATIPNLSVLEFYFAEASQFKEPIRCKVTMLRITGMQFEWATALQFFKNLQFEYRSELEIIITACHFHNRSGNVLAQFLETLPRPRRGNRTGCLC